MCIRDSARTQQAGIEALQSRACSHKAGVAGIYNRSTYENEKRTALDALGNYIKVAVAKATLI